MPKMQKTVYLEPFQSVIKVTCVIPIERKRLTMELIGIPFFKALILGFLDRLGMTR